MPIWRTESVDVQPVIELGRWHVAEVDGPGGEKDHHFIGWNVTDGEGRVSSKIMEYDSDTRIGVTRSGRRYQLRGESGYNSDAAYVWDRWRQINSVKEWVNVSDEYEASDSSS